MTDNDIIKALECCCKNNNCEGCPLDFLTFSSQCASELAIKSLDLINRQQAEIERLKKEKDEYAYLYDKHISTAFSHIKSEAYKEFADLSIKRICEQVSAPTPSESYIVERCNEEIDNLVKEMAGE